MRELQLVGYTADLLHLVFTETAEGGARFKAPIDEDFVATLTEVLELVDPDSAPLGSLLSRVSESAPQPAATTEAEQEEPEAGDDGEGFWEPETGPAPRGEGPLAGMAAAQRPITSDNGKSEKSEERVRPSKLAPREIQALLRAGQGPRSVAKQADTDEQWVRRWLPPIEAERDQVLQAVRSSFVAKSRLGLSSEPVGEAVEKNLAAKGIHEDDPSLEWVASRREGEPHWRVVLRYRSRGRAQRALWNFNPDTGELDPRNDLAVEIAWVRPRKSAPSGGGRPRRTQRSGASSRSRGVKKASPRKSSAKKSSAAKNSGKKASVRKSSGKKAPATKSSTKKASAKKTAATKSSATKSSATKSSGTKNSATKSTKSSANKAAAKTTAAKKAPTKKAPTKKAAPKKAAAAKSSVKKSSVKKSSASKASPPPAAPPQ